MAGRFNLSSIMAPIGRPKSIGGAGGGKSDPRVSGGFMPQPAFDPSNLQRQIGGLQEQIGNIPSFDPNQFATRDDLENRPIYDDTALRDQITSIGQRPGFDDSALRQMIEQNANRPQFDASGLQSQIGGLQDQFSNMPQFDDSSIRQMIEANKQQIGNIPQFDSSQLQSQIGGLEDRLGNMPQFDDSNLRQMIEQNKNRPGFDSSNLQSQIGGLQDQFSNLPQFDDSSLRQMIEQNKNLPQFDPSALQNRLKQLEGRETPTFDPSQLQSGIAGLQDRMQNMPQFDPSQLQNRLKTLEGNKPQDMSGYARKEDLPSFDRQKLIEEIQSGINIPQPQVPDMSAFESRFADMQKRIEGLSQNQINQQLPLGNTGSEFVMPEPDPVQYLGGNPNFNEQGPSFDPNTPVDISNIDVGGMGGTQFADMPVMPTYGTRDSIQFMDPITGEMSQGGSTFVNYRNQLKEYYDANPGAQEYAEAQQGQQNQIPGIGKPRMPPSIGGPGGGITSIGQPLSNEIGSIGGSDEIDPNVSVGSGFFDDPKIPGMINENPVPFDPNTPVTGIGTPGYVSDIPPGFTTPMPGITDDFGRGMIGDARARSPLELGIEDDGFSRNRPDLGKFVQGGSNIIPGIGKPTMPRFDREFDPSRPLGPGDPGYIDIDAYGPAGPYIGKPGRRTGGTPQPDFDLQALKNAPMEQMMSPAMGGPTQIPTGPNQIDPVLLQQATSEQVGDPLLRSLYFGTADSPGFYNQLQQAGSNLIGSEVPLQQTAGLSPLELLSRKQAVAGLGGFEPFLQQNRDLVNQAISQSRRAEELQDPYYSQAEEIFKDTMGGYDPSMTQQFYNPYEDQVVQQTIDDVMKSGDKQDIASRANEISSGAFGGSRARLGAGERRESLGKGLAQALGNIRSQGFQSAQQTGLGEFARQQQAKRTGAQGLMGIGLGRGSAASNLGQQLAGYGGQMSGIGSTQEGLRAGQRGELSRYGTTGRGIAETGLGRIFEQQVGQQYRPMQTLGQIGSMLPGYQASGSQIDSQYGMPTDPTAAGLGAAFSAYGAMAPRQGQS